MKIENKLTYLNKESTGFKIINSLENEVKIKNKNNKDTSFNVEIHNDVLALLDFIAEKFNVKRAYILNLLITEQTKSMFNALPTKERIQLAEHVDNELTRIGAEHSFRGETWMHDVKEVPHDYQNACEPSVFFKGKAKSEDKGGSTHE